VVVGETPAAAATSRLARRPPGRRLAALRGRAAESLGVYVADMPAAAQATRVYDDYRRRVEENGAADLAYLAVSLVGPRNRIDKLVHRLPLLP
jgi:hypothetical protein